jgi:hypothetical protein
VIVGVGGINGAGRRKRIAEFPDVAGSGGGAYSEGTKPRVEARSEIRFVNDAEEPNNDPDQVCGSACLQGCSGSRLQFEYRFAVAVMHQRKMP